MVPPGDLLRAIGGFAAGGFYLPIRKIKGWSWESDWLVNGFFSWLIAPRVVAMLVVPDLRGLPPAVPLASLGCIMTLANQCRWEWRRQIPVPTLV